jgi:hypothetical protein
LFDSIGAFGEISRATIASIGGTAGHYHVFDTIKADGSSGDFGKLGGGFAGDCPIGYQGLLDRAELADSLVIPVPHTGLEDGSSEDIVAMKEGDFPVWDAVRSGEVIKLGSFGKFDRGNFSIV